MSVVHILKTAPVYFDAVERGDKPFEIRLDDRGFQRGDIVRLLRLTEWPREADIYTPEDGCGATANPAYAHAVERRVTWILTDGFPGLERGYVALGLANVEAADV